MYEAIMKTGGTGKHLTSLQPGVGDTTNFCDDSIPSTGLIPTKPIPYTNADENTYHVHWIILFLVGHHKIQDKDLKQIK